MTLNPAVGAKYFIRVGLAVALALIANTAIAQSLKGTATYRERMALPPGAVFEATIEDVSRADAPAQTIARQRVESPGNPPIAFTIAYDPAKILQDRRYVVRASILVDGKLLFTTDTATPVITGGNPISVSLMMRRAGSGQAGPSNPAVSPASPASGLEGSSWQLVKFQGSDDTTLTPDDRTKYTIEFGTGGQLDCTHRLQSRAWNLEVERPESAPVRAAGADPRPVPSWLPARSHREAVELHPVVRHERRPFLPFTDGRRRDIRVRTGQDAEAITDDE